MIRRAFTLVELLIVVAIIALLISVLLPALGELCAQAKRAVCASNLRSIGVAIYNYWTEWNSRVPYDWTPMTNADFGDLHKPDADINPFDRERWSQSLPNVLMPTHMAEDPRIFVCPAAVNGWPRSSGARRFAYRDAGINQPGGKPDPDGSYPREHFAFLDGRVLWKFQMELVAEPQSAPDYIQNILEYAKSRGTYLRDLIQMRRADGDPVIGPHKGGTLVLNRDLQVEFRSQKTTEEDLAPNYAGSEF